MYVEVGLLESGLVVILATVVRENICVSPRLGRDSLHSHLRFRRTYATPSLCIAMCDMDRHLDLVIIGMLSPYKMPLGHYLQVNTVLHEIFVPGNYWFII